MPAYCENPERSLVVTLYRDGDQLDRRTADDGAQAVLVAMQVLAALTIMQPGDRLEVTEPDRQPDLPAVSRSSHYS